MTVIEQIAESIRAGYRPAIGNDPAGYYENGESPEGAWYISCGADSYWYYSTRADARAIVRRAQKLADSAQGL